MDRVTHRIGRQIMEFTFPQREEADLFRRRMAGLCETVLAREIDNVLTEAFPGREEIHFIDRVDLDLGTLSSKDVLTDEKGTELAAVIREKLREWFQREKVRRKRGERSGVVMTGSPSDEAAPDGHPEEAKFTILSRFLETGTIPWWAGGGVYFSGSMEDLFREMVVSQKERVEAFIRKSIENPVIRERLAAQFSDDTLMKTIRLLAGHSSAGGLPIRLMRLVTGKRTARVPAELRIPFWDSLFTALSQTGGAQGQGLSPLSEAQLTRTFVDLLRRKTAMPRDVSKPFLPSDQPGRPDNKDPAVPKDVVQQDSAYRNKIRTAGKHLPEEGEHAPTRPAVRELQADKASTGIQGKHPTPLGAATARSSLSLPGTKGGNVEQGTSRTATCEARADSARKYSAVETKRSGARPGKTATRSAGHEGAQAEAIPRTPDGGTPHPGPAISSHISSRSNLSGETVSTAGSHAEKPASEKLPQGTSAAARHPAQIAPDMETSGGGRPVKKSVSGRSLQDSGGETAGPPFHHTPLPGQKDLFATESEPLPSLKRASVKEMPVEYHSSDQTDKQEPTLRPFSDETAQTGFFHAIPVENSGLVLLWPHLKMFFQVLGLMDNGAFLNEKAAAKAIHLLQYLATSEIAQPEYLLPLNKLFCGWEISRPVPRNVRLSRKALLEGEKLLKAVIGQWAALGNTSVAGFRRAFLQRYGTLTEEKEGWTLRVERKPYDVLLERLPWGFGLIRLSWMKSMVIVEW